MNEDKQYVIEYAKRLWDFDFIVLDTETTGLNKNDEIVQIGIIGKDKTVLMDTLLKPSIQISEDAERVHGISNDAVKYSPTFKDIYPRLNALIRFYKVVSYNSDFDERMIKQCCNKYEYNDIPGSWYDVMKSYALYWGEWNPYRKNYKWQKLTAACEQQGIKIKDSHSAIGDCKLTLELIKKMAGV